MSIITNIVVRGSPSVEKLAFSASGALLLLMILNFTIFNTFLPQDLLYANEKSFQISFLLYTLVLAIIIYSFEPVEVFWILKVRKILNGEFIFGEKLTFESLRGELPIIRNEYNLLISNVYLMLAVIILIPVVILFGENWIEWFQWIISIGILIVVMTYLFHKSTQRSRSFLVHVRLSLHSYSKFFKSKDEECLENAIRGSWTVLGTDIHMKLADLISLITNSKITYFSKHGVKEPDETIKPYIKMNSISTEILELKENLNQLSYHKDLSQVQRLIKISNSTIAGIDSNAPRITEQWRLLIKAIDRLLPQFDSSHQKYLKQTILLTLYEDINPKNMKNTLSNSNFFERFTEVANNTIRFPQTRNSIIRVLNQMKTDTGYLEMVESLLKLISFCVHQWETIEKFNDIRRNLISSLQAYEGILS